MIITKTVYYNGKEGVVFKNGSDIVLHDAGYHVFFMASERKKVKHLYGEEVKLTGQFVTLPEISLPKPGPLKKKKPKRLNK